MPTNRMMCASAVTMALVVGLIATTAATSAPSTQTTTVVQTPSFGEPFAVSCGFSHRSYDDPIVYPGEPGRSHNHTFFGNRATNAFATPDYLRVKEKTTCAEPADASAYWAPTLFVGKGAVEPLALVATYSRRTRRPVVPFPEGFMMIAGTATATSPQSKQVTFWSCAVIRAIRSSTIPSCPGARRGGLRLHVNFPNCWDGRQLDSADHKNHVAYSGRAACPASHPVALPALSLVIYYPITGRGSVQLASGGQFSGHADFMNAWQQATLNRLVATYLNTKKRP